MAYNSLLAFKYELSCLFTAPADLTTLQIVKSPLSHRTKVRRKLNRPYQSIYKQRALPIISALYYTYKDYIKNPYATNMGQYTNLDSDKERLPEGFTRVGYDADTAIYVYQDADGNLWTGKPNQRYGVLSRVGDSDDDTCDAEHNADQKGNDEKTAMSAKSQPQNCVRDSNHGSEETLVEKEGKPLRRAVTFDEILGTK